MPPVLSNHNDDEQELAVKLLLLPGSSSRRDITATLDAVLKQHIAHGRLQRPVIVDTFTVGLAPHATARDNISSRFMVWPAAGLLDGTGGQSSLERLLADSSSSASTFVEAVASPRIWHLFVNDEWLGPTPEYRSAS